ncbi:MAG: hypothetical protein ACFFB3_11715 [Candidatus Hodarchaeota archaeon]
MSNQANAFPSAEGDVERAVQRVVGEENLENRLCRLEKLWHCLSPTEATLTVAWGIHMLHQVDDSLTSIGIDLGLADKITTLTVCLERGPKPLADDWALCKEELGMLLAKLREWFQQTPSVGTAKHSATGGQIDDQ